MHIRKAQLTDVPAITQVHLDSWQSSYAGIIPDDVLSNLSYERRERFWRERLSQAEDDLFVYVAESGEGNLAGFASGGPERDGDQIYTGELYAIYLLDSYKRQGMGRGLILAVMDELSQRGFQAMLVWVLADNPPARAFYEALGGKLLPSYTKEISIGEAKLVEVAYGWSDISGLL